MPVSLKYTTFSKNLGKTPKKNTTKNKKSRLFGRGGVPAKTLWKEVKTLKKNKNISRLFGRGGSQPRLSENYVFFVFLSKVFLGFGHFQPFAPFCTMAVRCLHAFKLAGTNRLTTAAMNILGLRIKTVCSNFEMFSHVLDNNLSFLLYFFENKLHKLAIRPSSQAFLHHRWKLL